MPRYAPNKGKGKGPLLESAILASPNTPPAEIAEQFGCSRIYVQKVRERLVRAGKVPGRLVPRRASPSRPDKEFTAAAEAAFIAGDDVPMSLLERRIFLSRLAQSTDREEIKVQALSALNRLEANIQTTDDLGPPDPKTAVEADLRITELIVAREEVFGTHFHRRPRATTAPI